MLITFTKVWICTNIYGPIDITVGIPQQSSSSIFHMAHPPLSSSSSSSSSSSYPVPRDHLTTRRPSEELTLPAAYRALGSLGLLMLIDASGFVPSRRVADASNILINIVIKPAGRQLLGLPSASLSSRLTSSRSVSSNDPTKIYTQNVS